MSDILDTALDAIARRSDADAETVRDALRAAAEDTRGRKAHVLSRLVQSGRRDLAVRLYQETIRAAEGNVLAAAAALRMSRASAYRVARELGLDDWLDEQYPDRPGTAGAAARHGR